VRRKSPLFPLSQVRYLLNRYKEDLTIVNFRDRSVARGDSIKFAKDRQTERESEREREREREREKERTPNPDVRV